VPLRGAAVPTSTAWASPLGEIAIDVDSAGDYELVRRELEARRVLQS